MKAFGNLGAHLVGEAAAAYVTMSTSGYCEFVSCCFLFFISVSRFCLARLGTAMTSPKSYSNLTPAQSVRVRVRYKLGLVRCAYGPICHSSELTQTRTKVRQ